MNQHEIENALLLRDSGELSATHAEQLAQILARDPDWAALAEENRVLQAAGPLSSATVVPPLPELQRERILQAAAKPAPSALPRLLALAAMLVLGLALFPHLSNHLQPLPPVLTTAIEPVSPTLTSEDPILNELAELENELALWSATPPSDPGFIENEHDWAEILIAAEESI